MKLRPACEQDGGPSPSSGIIRAFALLSPSGRLITHALLTRPPRYCQARRPGVTLDLHVLSAPPAFVLSEYHTLRFGLEPSPGRCTRKHVWPGPLTTDSTLNRCDSLLRQVTRVRLRSFKELCPSPSIHIILTPTGYLSTGKCFLRQKIHPSGKSSEVLHSAGGIPSIQQSSILGK